MVCNSRDFTLAILQEMDCFSRLSAHLVEQVMGLSCGGLDRFRRALEALEEGKPRTRSPGAFDPGAVLDGYSHVHFLQDDWAAANFGLITGQGVESDLNSSIDAAARKIIDSGRPVEAEAAALAEKLRKRVSTSGTGDWILYKVTPNGNHYLAIHPHTARNSPEEHALKALLDSITV